MVGFGHEVAMTSDGELSSTAAKRATELAPSSPRSALPPEVSSKNPAGLHFRTTGGTIGARNSDVENEILLKKLAEARASRRYGNNTGPRSSKSESGCFQSAGFLQLCVAMALISLALVVLLALLHPSFSPSVEGASNGKEVTYGSMIKLQHDRTKFRLHSHEVPYGSGSGQQSVTAFPGVEDGNSYWAVKPSSDDESIEQGDVIPNGSIVRLQHMRTRKWLHSHLHPSPISGNLEVSAFGGDDQSDTGDYWRLEIEGKGKVWMQDQKVRLRHVDTNGYLHSHDKKYSRIVSGQQEVCGMGKKNADNLWTAAEGIYFLTRATTVE